MAKFKLVSKYQPTGDQPEAIRELVNGLNRGEKAQTLLGVTGSGKTFTMANIINEVQRPTLILAHNKTLAAQLYAEFREFFPENEVHYFVSYFDYYQPEAYIASTDTYIEKDSAINDEIDRLRHGATEALLTRRDVIVISDVSGVKNWGIRTGNLTDEEFAKIGDAMAEMAEIPEKRSPKVCNDDWAGDRENLPGPPTDMRQRSLRPFM